MNLAAPIEQLKTDGYCVLPDVLSVELIQHPFAESLVAALLGPAFLISNFTANIALPAIGRSALVD